MAIEINDSGNYVSYPIIKHQRIGEFCKLAVIRWEQRDQLRKDPGTQQMVKIPNGVDRNNCPRFKQELVIQAVAISGDMVAAIGDSSGVPAPGDRVRVILKAKGFGNWIEARKAHRGGKFNVGDVLVMSTDKAQQYDQNGTPKGAEIRTQAEAEAVPRNTTLGFYGPLSLAPGQEAGWIEAAEFAYRDDENAKRERNAIPIGGAAADGYVDEFDEEAPF
jgi:hypothetical protein